MRLDPTTGAYDVYVDGMYVTSGNSGTSQNDTDAHIRLWEVDGARHGGNLDFTNIEVFQDDYTVAIHNHEYRETVHFFDNSFSKYNVCDCGSKIVVESKGFSKAVVNGLGTVYNGKNAFTLRGWEYWFVTDMNIREEIGNGPLVNFGGVEAVKAKDGYIYVGDTKIAKITYPTSYQLAFYISSTTSFDVYFNGFKVATMSKSGATATRIEVGNDSFGHHVRFMHNRAVILNTTPDVGVEMTYQTDASIKRCYHESNERAENKYVKEVNGVITHSYICTKCGERVYAKLTNSLVSYENDSLFGYKSGALLKADLNSATMNTAKTLYLENGIIGKTASPYWISFNVTPKTLPTLEGLDVNDPNGAAQRGYNLVSAEAAFYPMSELRVAPTADGAEIRILQGSVDGNSANYKTAIAALALDETVNVAIYVAPAAGEFDVYIDGEYKGSAKKAGLDDYNPKILFHDNGAGEFVYSNITVATEAINLADSVNAFEFEAVYVGDKTKPEGYTSLASLNRTTANASYRFDILFVNNRTSELCFKDENGNYRVLTDNKGKAHKLSKESTSIIAVYDDVRATVRYYVNGTVPYYNKLNAMNIPVNDEFAGAAAITDRLETNSNIVKKSQIHGMEASGIMQVIALQQKVSDDSLRIVSGIDIPWYGSAGYKVTLYDANGNALGKESKRESTTIYSEIQADNVLVPASKYDYTYFVPIVIKNNGKLNEHVGDYFMVTPYVTIGETVLEGEQVKIIITENGYVFG